jgi:hypothetical protein
MIVSRETQVEDMIISFSRGFVFVHIHKCAGSSIEKQCAPFLQPWDILLGPGRKGVSKIPEFLVKRTTRLRRHSSASEIKGFLGEERYDRMMSFSIVRHPEDRIVSLYKFYFKVAQWTFGLPRGKTVVDSVEHFWKSHHLSLDTARKLSRQERFWFLKRSATAGKSYRWAGMDVFMSSGSFEDFVTHPSIGLDHAFHSQFSMLTNPGTDSILVKQILRQESLASDWSKLGKSLNIPGSPPVYNSSQDVERPHVTKRAREEIQKIFIEDFKNFNYRFRS